MVKAKTGWQHMAMANFSGNYVEKDLLLEASEPEYLASVVRLWHRFKLDKSKWIPAEPIYVIPENIWIGFRRSILSTFNKDIQHHFSSPLIFHENRFIIHSTEGLHSVSISLNSIYHTILTLYHFQQLRSFISLGIQ